MTTPTDLMGTKMQITCIQSESGARTWLFTAQGQPCFVGGRMTFLTFEDAVRHAWTSGYRLTDGWLTKVGAEA